MKKFLYTFLTCLFAWSSTTTVQALEDGVYSISCQQVNGFVALGAYQNMDAYICYVTGSQDLTDDAYWIITNTDQGYTFKNQASGQYLIYTDDRDDRYYKWMTLSDDEPWDGSQYWNIFEYTDDGGVCIQSMLKPNYYWNLRASAGLLGTYAGSTRSANEIYYLTKKSDTPGPGPGPEPEPGTMTQFPSALHVWLKDGRLEAYPLKYITEYAEQNEQLVIQTNIGETFTYALSDVESVSEEAPSDFPTFESFKFNNKFNDQVFTDAIGEIVEDTVFVTISAIGKRLTPSFKVPDDETLVYVGGELQDSKVSRLRFDKDIYYVVTRPGITMLLPDEGETTSYSMQPYGRMMRVHVNWLTDRAEVPCIYINTEDGYSITSKTEYKNATIVIDGKGIFPSMEETYVQIKGRGNSSWSWPKKPYRLKFEQKVKPLGMTKGKSWVLLSNYQTGSLMSNAIGMKAANLMEASAANHIVPVDLYLNGSYQGSYNFTEKVGFSNNSVDIDDETAAAMLELDSYFDEPAGQKFRSQPYNLPINIKEPDFTEDETVLTLETVETDFNSFMSTLYRGKDISKHVDLEQLARFLMVNELICNFELYHPKSTFCYRESFESDTSKYVFGPVWDLDWAFGYEQSRNYFQYNATSNYWIDMPNFEVKQFIQDLRWKSQPLANIYKELWEKFMAEDLEELKEYCQDYYDFAHNSFDSNRSVWGDRTDYKQQAVTAANWLETRANQIYSDIINDVKPEIEIPDIPITFDNNTLYTITCRRGQLVLNEDHTGLAAGQVRTDAPEEDGLFAILDIDGHNFLYSPVTKQFLDCSNDGMWVSALGSELSFNDSQADGDYVYMISGYVDGTWLYFNNNSKKIVINSWSKPDDGNRWCIEPVADFDPTEALQLAKESLINVTFDYVFNGKIIQTEEYNLVPGSFMPEPFTTDNDFMYIESEDVLPVLANEDCHITYDVIWTGPFEFTQSLNKAHWYNMTIRSNFYVGKEDWEPYYPWDADEETLKEPEYQWAFGGDPFHVKVYNRADGMDKVLTLDGSPDDNQVNVVMREGDYSWTIRPNYDGFVLSPHDHLNVCINQFGGNSGALQTWKSDESSRDNGSTFRLYEIVNDILMGDVNGDEVVDLTDAIMIVYYSLGQIPAGFIIDAADVNGDNAIDLTDAIMVVYQSLDTKREIPAAKLLESIMREAQSE